MAPRRSASDPGYGLARGRIFPVERAGSLLNPLRRIVQPPSRTVGRLGLSGRETVLEIGCGPGYFTGALAAGVGDDGLVVALDLQAGMLQLARARTRSRRVRYVQGDATGLPVGGGSIDVAVVVLMLGEVPERARCVAELARVVRVGGRAIFCESRRDSDFIRLGALVALVEPSGFRLESRRGAAWEYTASFLRG